MRERFWLTPPDLMADLQERFAFDFDPCPNPVPKGFDGLTAEWGASNWVNPPFVGRMAVWVRRCADVGKTRRVVLAIPCFRQRAISQAVALEADMEWLGAVRWISIESGAVGEPVPTLIAIWGRSR